MAQASAALRMSRSTAVAMQHCCGSLTSLFDLKWLLRCAIQVCKWGKTGR